MAIIKTDVVCLETELITNNEILINCTNYSPYIPLETALLIKEKIDATIEFARNNDIAKLNEEYMLSECLGRDLQYTETQNKKNRKIKKTNVYVMIDKNTGYYKIGRSYNPLKREKTLQSEKPTIELIFSFEAPISFESELHIVFENKRIRGEWFNLSDEDILHIKQMIEFL